MTDNSLFATLGAATAGTLLGITALLYSQNYEKNQLREAKLNRIRDRKQKYIEKREIEAFIKDGQAQMKQKRRVHLHFDENDQMIEKEEEGPVLKTKGVKIDQIGAALNATSLITKLESV